MPIEPVPSKPAPVGVIGTLPTSPGPKLVAPSPSYAVIGAQGPLGVAAPNPDMVGWSRLLIRPDDLLVLRMRQYGNAEGQVFIEVDFPSQHAAESVTPASIFGSVAAGQTAVPPLSAGPFGWTGSNATTEIALDVDMAISYLQPPPQNPPVTATRLWWNDVSLPGTSLLFLVPGVTAGGAQAQSLATADLATLLDWSDWRICIAPGGPSASLFENPPTGSIIPTPRGAPSGDFGCRLAMMFGMVFTPTEKGGWTHLDLPLYGATGRNELWHTRLVPPTGGGPAPTLRAIWSLPQQLAQSAATDLTGFLFPDNAIAVNPSPILYDGVDNPADSTTPYSVKYPGNTWVEQPPSILTGGSAMTDLVAYTTYDPPQNIGMELPAQDVLLSAAGGSLETSADFTSDSRLVTPATEPGRLLYFSHRQALGRDVSATSALTASLAPFGQPVIFGDSFRRSVAASPAPAALAQVDSVHVLVRAAQLGPQADFTQPFRSLTLATKSFPPLYRDPATGLCYPLGPGGQAPVGTDDRPTGQPIPAAYEAVDAAGAVIAFELPLQVLLAAPTAASVTLSLNQQRVAFSTAANSTFETASLQISAMQGGAFGFQVAGAVINHPAISQFTGVEPVHIAPPAQPSSDALAQIVTPLALDGTQHTDRYGAFAAPKIPALAVLSKSLGAAGAAVPGGAASDVDALITALFGDTSLLGVFPLAGLIEDFAGKAGGHLPPLPMITSSNVGGAVAVQMTFDSGASPGGQGLSVDMPGSVATLGLEGVSFSSVTTHGPGGTSSTGSCVLQSPTISIPAGAGQLVSFAFDTMTFTASSAAKPTVSVDFSGVTFYRGLSFVNAIIAILPSSLFSNPPEITVSDTQCVVDCGVGFPSVGIGVFALSNINLDATLTIPFVADPASASQVTFAFDFSTVDDPFTLSVLGFAGAGSFGVAISPNQVTVNGSLAFGGQYSLSVVVAEGWVSLEAGVHITYASSPSDPGDTDVDVGGFVHLSGGVEVLGLVSVTLDAMLSLDYDSTGDSFTGSAEVTLGVDLTFFHTSVSFSVSETFSGAAPAPSDMERLVVTPGVVLAPPRPDPFANAPGVLSAVRQVDWEAYCGAFAA